MTINLSGQAIKDVRVAGAQAQRVMLGTGSTAVEVWSADIRSGAQIWMPLDPPDTPLLEHAGTLSPAISTSTLQARDGYAYTPSGAGAGASMHYAGTWDTGGTVSMWVRQTGQSGGAHAAFYRKSGTTEVAMWQHVGASPPYILFSLIMNGTVVDLHATGVTVPNGRWVMLTITVSRPAGSSLWTVRGYVNGQSAGSVTRSAAAQPIAPGSISFAGTSWGGDLDDLLVWDRPLAPAEVAQVYAWGMRNSYTDADYYYPLTGMSLQNEGLKSTPLTSEAGALADRGNHAWLAGSVPRIDVTESWSSGWTASAWFEQTGAHPGGSGYLFSRGSAARGASIYVAAASAASHRLTWRLDDGTTLTSWVSQDNILPTSGWFHFAVTAEYVSPNYKLRFFVNGNMVRSSNMSSSLNNLVFAPDDWASFGNASTGNNYSYGGNIDDIAMWPRKLTDEEVASVYAEGRSDSSSGMPTVAITGTSSNQSRDQFRQACIDHGTTYQTVQVLPFLLDTSQATNLSSMFDGCSALTTVPDMDTSQATALDSMFYHCSSLTTVPDLNTSNVTHLPYMFENCSSLTDGNVRCIGRHPSVYTRRMIYGSGLTREPFYDTNGNPI